jgi:hypothetical protein
MVRLKWMEMVIKFEHSLKSNNASLFLKNWAISCPHPLDIITFSKVFTKIPANPIARSTFDACICQIWPELQNIQPSSKEKCNWLNKQFAKIKPSNFLTWQLYPRITQKVWLFCLIAFFNLRCLFHSFRCNYCAHPVRAL